MVYFHFITSSIFSKVSEDHTIAAEPFGKLQFDSNFALQLKKDGFRARIGRHGENVERLAP